MKHFVSIILSEYKMDENLVESILDSAKIGLLESQTLYEMFETDNDEQVLRVQLPRQLTVTESDEFADVLANKLFEMGYENFDLEVSAEDQELPFDIAEDLQVFMKNDAMFYRRVYYPAMVKIADQVKQKKKVNFITAMNPVIDKALNVYCKRYDLPSATKDQFTQDHRSELINRIREEESPNIQNGDY
jgi:hypothetical protein